TERSQLGQMLALQQQVLDLGGEVERQRREFRVQRAGHGQRMTRTVEKVRIAERHVRSAGVDLLPDVGQHDVAWNNEEPSPIDRRNRTVTTAVLASTA